MNCPGLKSDENYSLAKEYLKGFSDVISFVVKGGKENAMDSDNAALQGSRG